MSLAYEFKAAKKRLATLDDDERVKLLSICRDIHAAQVQLSIKAVPILERCMTVCQGLCCRNIRVSDIITGWDLTYILAMAPHLETEIDGCLRHEGLFSAPCLFLENGTGPCLFPDNIRPERCIISFCRVEPLVEKEIARVMRGFGQLIRFFTFRPYRRLVARFARVGSPNP